MKRRRSAALAVLFLVLAGCSSGRSPTAVASASAAPTRAASASAIATPRATARPTISLVALDKATLKGTGSKTGPVIVLGGDYVFRDSVTSKPGCHFKAYLDGLGDDPIDEVESDYAGSNTSEASEQGLDLRTYTLRVVATNCGAWTVSMTRK